MTILSDLLSTYVRSGLRGSFRSTKFFADLFSSLHQVPFETAYGRVFLDFRITSALGIVAQPKSTSGEDAAMEKFVSEGDVVFDIGAHFGFYTLLLARLTGKTGKVFAFEPNGDLLTCLRKTITGLKNTQLFEVALSDREGHVELFVPEDASMASLVNWTGGIGGDVHMVECEVKRLDDLVECGDLPLPQFIKCDVEGAELSIFRGGSKTLNRMDAAVIMFEVNATAAKSFDVDIAEYFAILESLQHAQYKFFEVTPAGISPLINREIDYANVAAIPVSRLGSYNLA